MPLFQGQIINSRYRIVKLLAEGGFGAVYRALDMNLSRPCAVKENFETSLAAQNQFLREASILATLRHPNLPVVTDHFILPGQGQYLVMDFIEGEDLQEMLDRASQPLPEAQAKEWIAQICDALIYLHSQNPPIIHRDIKPANITITPQRQAMLVDFGIAKLYVPSQKTTAGARAVTPSYSPPEQYGMGTTDARSDIYALGATLYAVLTGREPVDSVNRATGTSLPMPHSLNPRISRDVEKVILKAIEMRPAMRFQSAIEFKAAIGRKPSLTSPPPPTREFKVAPMPAPMVTQPLLPIWLVITVVLTLSTLFVIGTSGTCATLAALLNPTPIYITATPQGSATPPINVTPQITATPQVVGHFLSRFVAVAFQNWLGLTSMILLAIIVFVQRQSLLGFLGRFTAASRAVSPELSPLTIHLRRTLDDAEKSILQRTRAHFVETLLHEIQGRNSMQGRILLLYADDKVGTSSMTEFIRRKLPAHNLLILSIDTRYCKTQQDVLREFFRKLRHNVKKKDSYQYWGLQRFVSDAYQRVFDPKPKKRSREGGIEVPGFGSTGLSGGKLGAYLNIEENELNRLSERDLLNLLERVIDEIALREMRLLIFLDKISKPRLVALLISILNTKGVTSVLVAQKNVFEQHAQIFGTYTNREPAYVPRIWDVGSLVVEEMIGKRRIAKNPLYGFLGSYIDYRSQGMLEKARTELEYGVYSGPRGISNWGSRAAHSMGIHIARLPAATKKEGGPSLRDNEG